MTYQIWNDPNSPKATGFNEWWESFQEEHEEWKFADREALLKAAFDAGRGLAPLPVQNSVAVVRFEECGMKLCIDCAYYHPLGSDITDECRHEKAITMAVRQLKFYTCHAMRSGICKDTNGEAKYFVQKEESK